MATRHCQTKPKIKDKFVTKSKKKYRKNKRNYVFIEQNILFFNEHSK